MKAESCIKVLEQHMLPSRWRLFQQDKAKPHTAAITTARLCSRRFRLLNWPACSFYIFAVYLLICLILYIVVPIFFISIKAWDKKYFEDSFSCKKRSTVIQIGCREWPREIRWLSINTLIILLSHPIITHVQKMCPFKVSNAYLSISCKLSSKKLGPK